MKEHESANKLANIFYSIENIILTITMITVLVFVFIGTILRYVFSTSIVGMDEVTLVIALYCYFFGASCASRSRDHIRVNIIDELLANKKIYWIINLFKSMVSIFVTIAFCYVSILYGIFVLEAKITLSPFGVSKIVVVSSLIIGYFLMTVHETVWFIRLIRGNIDKNKKDNLLKKGGVIKDNV